MKKLNTYFAQKREIRELTLDSLRKINQVITAIAALTDTITTAANAFDTEELKSLLESIQQPE